MARGKSVHISSGTLRNSFDRRTILLGGLQGGVGVLLAARMAWLGLAENAKYQMLAESNRVNLALIPPRRGWILDRHGAPLASNRADFRVDLIPERLVDPDGTIETLGKLLDLDAVAIQDLKDKMDRSHGFQPVEVASNLDEDKYAAVSVRIPDLPGVVPQRGFSRYYATGPSVGHLVGYVGPATAEDYERERNPLLITPGFRIGKDGLEKHFDTILRGVPGARRTEVTATGRIVRDLETREDTPGHPIKTTIDAPLQDYAARRLGPESGAVMVIDLERGGDILAMVSMPSFDPNSFADGIGRIEWKMLSDDDHVPLRNKVLRGLFPPGSTVKPMVALSFLEAGLDPNAYTVCNGGLQVGNRVFHCWNHRGHGQVDMAKGIYQSCDVYFYHFAQQIGMDPIAAMARRLGLGQTFDLPVAGQSYGTVPDPAWKLRKYKKPWAIYDTVNATIGQGYMLVNPLQQSMMVSRLASGLEIEPRLMWRDHPAQPRSLGIPQEHFDVVRAAMNEVVNGRGTAGRARLPFPDIQMAGKTGTAQVVSLSYGNGKNVPWKYRDHGHFICFAPFDKPRYACAVVVEHGGGSGAAYPIARDVMTFLFDPAKAMDVLLPMEAEWGGTPQQRMAARYAAYETKYGINVPKAADDAGVEQAEDSADEAGTPPQPMETAAASPPPEEPLPAPPSASAPVPPSAGTPASQRTPQ